MSKIKPQNKTDSVSGKWQFSSIPYDGSKELPKFSLSVLATVAFLFTSNVLLKHTDITVPASTEPRFQNKMTRYKVLKLLT